MLQIKYKNYIIYQKFHIISW